MEFSLSTLASYGGSWEEVDRDSLKSLDPNGFKEIKSAEVVEKEQEWGMSTSICLFLKGNRQKYLSLSNRSELEVGDSVDPASIELIELERDGETIIKADGKVKKSK